MPQHWAETLIAETAASSPLAAAAARAAHQARLPLLPKRADPQQPEDQRQGVRLQRRASRQGRGTGASARRGCVLGQHPVAVWGAGTPNGTPASPAASLRAVAAPSRCVRWPAAAR